MAASEPCSLASLHGPCFLMNAQPALAPRRKRHLLHHLDPDPGRPDDDEAVRERALGQPSRDGAGPPEIVVPHVDAGKLCAGVGAQEEDFLYRVHGRSRCSGSGRASPVGPREAMRMLQKTRDGRHSMMRTRHAYFLAPRLRALRRRAGPPLARAAWACGRGARAAAAQSAR